MFAFQDTAAAAENMLLCAAGMGYGDCWVGAFDEEGCRAALCISAEETPVILLHLRVPQTAGRGLHFLGRRGPYQRLPVQCDHRGCQPVRHVDPYELFIADCYIDGLTVNGVDIAALLDRKGISEEGQA